MSIPLFLIHLLILPPFILYSCGIVPDVRLLSAWFHDTTFLDCLIQITLDDLRLVKQTGFKSNSFVTPVKTACVVCNSDIGFRDCAQTHLPPMEAFKRSKVKCDSPRSPHTGTWRPGECVCCVAAQLLSAESCRRSYPAQLWFAGCNSKAATPALPLY